MAMDFFAQQERARRKTKWLVLYFSLAVILLIISIYFISLIVFSGVEARHSHRFYDAPPAPFALWNPTIFLGSTAGVLLVIILGSTYKTSELSSGGGAVANLMGGKLIVQGTADPNERKLLNVIEEMSIASGVPMPQVYVLNDERGINAFAAGHSTGDAAIGVTRGAIEMLSRDELQGVIGHEFSHILNGDMRLNIRLISIIFGLLCLATIGRILMNTRGGNSRDRNALPIFGLALIALGFIGVFFGRLIQAAVSRQREFLADASSVQFTRNPGGLSGALQKIGRYSYGSKLESDHAPDMCHMFFSNGLSDAMFGVMATHPPIPDRIHAIDPNWDGKFPPLKPEQIETVRQAAYSDLARIRQRKTEMLSSVLGTGILAGENNQPPVIRTNSVLPNLGNPTPLHLKYAEKLRDELPENLRSAARDPLAATALIYALLLGKDATLRTDQLAGIASRDSQTASEKTASLYPDVAQVARRARLPLVNIAIGSLRNLSSAQFQTFSSLLDWLADVDGNVALFEFVLQKIIMHHLGPKFANARPATIQYYTIKPVVPDCAVVLSALANVSSNDPAECVKAFAAGAPFLRAPLDLPLELLPPDQCGVKQIDIALDRLTLVVPIIKKNLLDACARVIGADGVILETEAELIRAVADKLDCPMPPLGISETATT
jgi:Zn-dependent protease with chaperone function